MIAGDDLRAVLYASGEAEEDELRALLVYVLFRGGKLCAARGLAVLLCDELRGFDVRELELRAPLPKGFEELSVPTESCWFGLRRVELEFKVEKDCPRLLEEEKEEWNEGVDAE